MAVTCRCCADTIECFSQRWHLVEQNVGAVGCLFCGMKILRTGVRSDYGPATSVLHAHHLQSDNDVSDSGYCDLASPDAAPTNTSPSSHHVRQKIYFPQVGASANYSLVLPSSTITIAGYGFERMLLE